MGRAKQNIDEKKLSNWNLLDDFRRRLAKVAQTTAPKPKRPGGPERLLLEQDYFCLILFGLFNPVVQSMRGLCAASHLERVQKDVGGRKVSLGCRHLMAESPEGVAIQIYSALIAALMLQLLTGKRPGKRAMELIRFYLLGYADLEEVIALLAPKIPKKSDA